MGPLPLVPGEAVAEVRAERVRVDAVSRLVPVEGLHERAAPEGGAPGDGPVEVPEDDLSHGLLRVGDDRMQVHDLRAEERARLLTEVF